MTNDIKLALQHHTELNSGNRYWASFEAIQHSPLFRTVRLDIGLKHDGHKEMKIATRHYSLNPDGSAHFCETVHS